MVLQLHSTVHPFVAGGFNLEALDMVKEVTYLNRKVPEINHSVVTIEVFVVVVAVAAVFVVVQHKDE